MYKCEICNTEHELLEERIACETECLKKRKEEEAKRKQMERQENMKASTNALEEKLAEADAMIKKHLSEFETLSLNRNYYYLSYLFGKRTLWF